MTQNVQGVLLKKSKQTNNDGTPKLPTSNKLVEGEIALNYAKGVETISTKNESGTVVTFSSDDYYTAKKLGSGFTGENSAKTVTEAIANADWDETDETSPAFILNKPFGDECEYVIGYESTFTAVQTGPNDYGIGNWSFSGGTSWKYGDTYRVTINDDVYVTNAVYFAGDNIGLNMEEGAESPFTDTWSIYKDINFGNFLSSKQIALGDTVHLKVEQLTCTAKTIDNKYLDTIWESGTGDGSATRKGLHSNAVGQYSVAEAAYCNAVGVGSHCESQYGTASGNSSHAEGFATTAYSQYSHTEGYVTNANGSAAHAEGQSTHAIGSSSHAEGANATALGNSSHAEGNATTAHTDYSHAEGNYTMASGSSSHAEGRNTSTYGGNSHAEGYGTTASGNSSHAEGLNTSTYGENSHAEGNYTMASGSSSHAEGRNTSTYGENSHAEGYYAKASGSSSHAEGYYTIASSNSSHAEGSNTSTYGESSHAEGYYTTASGNSSHAEGSNTKAYGNTSHVEGNNTKAYGNASHAEGMQTIAYNDNEHASGQFNVSSSGSSTFGDSGNTLFSVGNGANASSRHNAFEIRQNGDIYIVNKDGNDVKLQDEIGNITVDQVIDSTTSASTNPVSTSAVFDFVEASAPTVDQVLDNTTSASTNPVSSKAVYDAVTDNELVWTNAYVAMSGAVSSHTSNNDIHVTQAEKQGLGEASGITSMTGYEIAQSPGDILTTDTLIQAIGKLEKRIAMLEAALEIQNNGDIYAGGGEYESL